MKKLGILFAALFSAVSISSAAFIVEVVDGGLGFDNFTGSGSTSIPSAAVGLQGTNSLYGGSDDYTFSYTPGVDIDNFSPAVGIDLGNGDLSEGLEGGVDGLYAVYVTWPTSANVDGAGSTVTITQDGEDVVLDPIVMNTGDPNNPGGSDAWARIATVDLSTGNTYSVNVLANNPSFVSQRMHGVMWERVTPVPEPSTYALVLGVAILGLAIWRRRK